LAITAPRIKVRPLWSKATELAKVVPQLITTSPEKKPMIAKYNCQVSEDRFSISSEITRQAIAPRENQCVNRLKK